MTTTLTIALAHALCHENGRRTAHVPAAVDLDEVLEFLDMRTHAADLDALLPADRRVALVWGPADVRARRPDLSDDQAWQVLRRVRDDHARGGHPDLLEAAAKGLFPAVEHAKGRLRARAQALLGQIAALPSDGRLDPVAYEEVVAQFDAAAAAVRRSRVPSE